MSNIQLIQNFLDKYILPSKERSNQLSNLKIILYVNPLVIYETEERWRQNENKLKVLTMYNQAKSAFGYSIGYIAAIQLIGLINFRVSKQYSLRKAWAQHVCRNTFWIPAVSYLTYVNAVLDKQKLFEEEILKMQTLPNEHSYLYSEKYVKEKYFLKINQKLNSLCEDSYILANTNTQIQAEQEEQEKQNMSKQISNENKGNLQKVDNNKQKSDSVSNKKDKQKENLRTDDYYFEISEVIVELDEESFFG